MRHWKGHGKSNHANDIPLARARQAAGVRTLGTPLNATISEFFCTGFCCEPLARNRSCAFSNLLFRPPASFFFLTDERRHGSAPGRKDFCTYLHNRFITSSPHSAVYGGNFPSFSMWAPRLARPRDVTNVTAVLDSPVYLAADLHSNPAHNMFDSVYPSIVALLRLAHSMPSALRARLQLPHPMDGDFTFLLVDSPLRNVPFPWHRGRRERAWAEVLAGRALDLEQLAAACPPPGCLIRSAFAGAGHIGMTVDEHNVMGGARLHRSLWRFGLRAYSRFKVKPGGGPWIPLNEQPLTVLIVEQKRPVLNLVELVAAINNGGVSWPLAYSEQFGANAVSTLGGTVNGTIGSGAKPSGSDPNRFLPAVAKLIKWENLTFAEQLREMSRAAVQVSGVGTASNNHVYLPRGAVAVNLGWRLGYTVHNVQRRITYFDSHVVSSLDHVRVLYYPDYDDSELDTPRPAKIGRWHPIRLNLTKALGVVRYALEIHSQGFSDPVPLEANGNIENAAFARLVQVTKGRALMARSGDEPWDGTSSAGVGKRMGNYLQGGVQCCMANSINEILLADGNIRNPMNRGGFRDAAGKVLSELGL